MNKDKNYSLNKATADRIRLMRKIMGLSQSTFASRLKVSPQQFHYYESGKTNITLEMLEIICGVLGVQPQELLRQGSSKDRSLVAETENSYDLPPSQTKEMLDFILQSKISSFRDKDVSQKLLHLIDVISAAKADVD